MSEKNKIKVLGLAGSLRQGSYNRALLQAAKELSPENMEIEIFDLAPIPLFNQDLELSLPEAVLGLKRKIKEADAILFVTPEYNHSIPGVLKNAIDWGSRPYGDNSWDNKPAAIMGASTGMLGTARAQTALRDTFVFLNIHPINKPEIMVGLAKEKFDDQNKLIDEKTKEFIKSLLAALGDWVEKLVI